MKREKKNDSVNARRAAVAVAAAAVLAAAAVGLTFACRRLREVWQEQCAVVRVTEQVTISAGKMVRDDAIKEAFGLREGANLAQIDFAAKRDEILKKYPTIRDLSIVRRVPDKVGITVLEREPEVRLGVAGKNRSRPTGRVADKDGIVFPCRRGTDMLPVILEAREPGTPLGQRLDGRALAALRLLELARDPEFKDLGVRQVDVSKPDYVIVTFEGGTVADFAWEGMDDPTDPHLGEMADQLRRLAGAMRLVPTDIGRSWNATIPGQASLKKSGVY